MSINVVEVNRTYEYLLKHPEELDQRSWISPCGTTACTAGITLLLHGYKPIAESDGKYFGIFKGPDGEVYPNWKYDAPSAPAAKILGLQRWTPLFDSRLEPHEVMTMLLDIIHQEALHEWCERRYFRGVEDNEVHSLLWLAGQREDRYESENDQFYLSSDWDDENE